MTNRPLWAADDPDKLVPDQLSIVTPEQFDRAFEAYGQFGPQGLIPIEERWQAVIPDVDRAKYAALKTRCHDIQLTASRWAEDLRRGRIAGDRNEVLRSMIAARYPFLTRARQIQLDTFAWFVTR